MVFWTITHDTELCHSVILVYLSCCFGNSICTIFLVPVVLMQYSCHFIMTHVKHLYIFTDYNHTCVGPGGLLGAVEGLSYATLIAGVTILGFQASALQD